MSNSSAVWAFFPYPDYFTLFNTALVDLPEYYRTEETLGWRGELTTYCDLSLNEVGVVCSVAALWIVLRWFLTHAVFSPMGKWLGLTEASRVKFPESAWRLFYKTGAWSLGAYVLFANHFEAFADPSTHWQGWNLRMPVPPGLQLVYVINGGFYLHCLIATLFLDAWRNDSMMLLVHHVVTLGLIGLSYCARLTTTGMVVIFCHDFNDILLESAKCMIYTKVRFGKHHKLNKRLADVAFGLFYISWIMTRLYWFPLKPIYCVLPSVLRASQKGHVPFILELNIMVWTILAMNIVWFCIITNILIKIVTGQMAEMEDVREKQKSGFLKKKGSDENMNVGAVGEKSAANRIRPVDENTEPGSQLLNADGLKKRTIATAAAGSRD